jgi:ferrous iron transport protein B
MASRTIENESDRRMTIITTTFIPCGAKLPIIALIAGALFNGAAWVAPAAYFIGIAAIVTSGIILRKFRFFAGDPAPFVMELPAYHVPSFKGVVIHMWDRAKAFVQKAGTIIFLSAIVVWLLSSFDWSFSMVETADSILAAIGRVLTPIFAPLGFGQWEAAVASLTGLVAKENLVGTLGVLYGFGEVAENGIEYWARLQAAFTPLAAFSLLVFNLLCAPCFAAMGAIRREMGGGKLTWFAIAYQTGFAYVISLIIFQLGMLFGGNGFTLGSAAGITLTAIFLYLLFRPYKPQTLPQVRSTAVKAA